MPLTPDLSRKRERSGVTEWGRSAHHRHSIDICLTVCRQSVAKMEISVNFPARVTACLLRAVGHGRTTQPFALDFAPCASPFRNMAHALQNS